MRPLAAVERFFERLFERPSATLFRARIQPVQVLRRVEREMERERRTVDGRLEVPDRFTVRLQPTDLERLAPIDSIPIVLASGALAFARQHGYALVARPRVAVIADAGVRRGEIEVEARFSEPSTGQALDDDMGQTRRFEVPVHRGPQATLAMTDRRGRTTTVVAGEGVLSIGRADDNALVLHDPGVSRHHARLAVRGGLLVLTDLGSTNGTRVNDELVRELAIGTGDVIRIGDVRLTVTAIDGGD